MTATVRYGARTPVNHPVGARVTILTATSATTGVLREVGVDANYGYVVLAVAGGTVSIPLARITAATAHA